MEWENLVFGSPRCDLRNELQLSQGESLMFKLTITDLSPMGSELFQDCESFLEELTDETLDHLVGARGSEDEIVIDISSYMDGKTFKGINTVRSVGKNYSNFTFSNKTGIVRSKNVIGH